MDWVMLDGVAKGFNQGVQNLVRIKEAGMRLKMDQEKFEIDKKVSNLQLQKYEQELDPEIFQARKKALSLESKMKDLEFESAKLKQQEAEKRAKQDMGEVITTMNTLKAQNPLIDFTFDPEKGMSFTTKKTTGAISFPQDIQIRSKISDMLLNEGKTPTEDAIQAKYQEMYGAYSGGATPSAPASGSSAPSGYKEIGESEISQSAVLPDGRKIGKTKSGGRAVFDPASKKWLTK